MALVFCYENSDFTWYWTLTDAESGLDIETGIAPDARSARKMIGDAIKRHKLIIFIG